MMTLGQQHAYMHGRAMNAQAGLMARHHNAIGQANNAIAGEMANRRTVMGQVRQLNADNTARIQQMQHERIMKSMELQEERNRRAENQKLINDVLRRI